MVSFRKSSAAERQRLTCAIRLDLNITEKGKYNTQYVKTKAIRAETVNEKDIKKQKKIK